MTTLDQINRDQNSRLDRLEGDAAIRSYVSNNYRYDTPGQYGEQLVESLKALYSRNVNQWRQVILNTGSAYSRAHHNFSRIKNLNREWTMAHDKMAVNILSGFAHVGLGWFAPVAQALVDRAMAEKEYKDITPYRPAGARADRSGIVRTYFSSGFEEIIRKSEIEFGAGLPPVVYDPKLDLPHTTPLTVIHTPLEFQNGLTKGFERCAGKVVAQFDHIINELRDEDSKPNRSIRRKSGYDANNPSSAGGNIIAKIDRAYGMVKNLVRQMNGHLVDGALYFSKKPDFGSDNAFIHHRSVSFERAMWAAWIQYNLKSNQWHPVPARPLVRSRSYYAGTWPPDGEVIHKELKPGVYFNPGSGGDRQVAVHYIKPGPTLVDRLEQLRIIKTKAGGPVDRQTLSDKELRQVADFGWYTSKADTRRLVQWAMNENQHLSPYAGSRFRFVPRARNEITVPGLS